MASQLENDIGLDTDQAVAPPPAMAQKTDENDSMYGYDDPEILTVKMSWKTVYENHLTKTTTLLKQMDLLEYWRGVNNVLSKVALQILAVPASSAPVERIFSHAGLILTAKRTKMKDDLLSALVKAKYNC